MAKENIFDGVGSRAQLVQVAYKLLISRQWITYTDIMTKYLQSREKELDRSISYSENYGELKKAFPAVRKAINEKFEECCIEEEGNNRNKRFRYIGEDNDPLADMRNSKVVRDLRQYWQFCQDSAGFFPTSWLEYFFEDCRDLFDIKRKRQKGEQVLSASLDRMLTNIDLLPSLYMKIINKQVLSIDYKPYTEEVRTLTFHPHYLKEYNGRWHLFGHAEDQTPEFGYNIALDRIVGKPKIKYNHDYVVAPKGFYKEFFNNIVGVSHLKDAKVEDIHIRAHNMYMYKLTETKKLHHTQEMVVPFGEHDDGKYGEFSVRVEVNNEFIGRIIQMGAGLEIVSPKEVRELFRQRVEELAKLYE